MTDSVASLSQQLQQLRARDAAGEVPATAFAEQQAELEKRLVAAVLSESAATPSPQPAPSADSPRPSRRLSVALTAAVLVLAAGGYAWTGSPGWPSAGAPGALTANADGSVDEAQFTAVVEQLALKLKERPDNAQAWAMLARSYARLNRPNDALQAYAKAVVLKGDDADLLTDYADLMAFQNGRSLQGEPTQLITRALQLDPQHPKALALAGSAAFDRKEYAAAVRHWELLASVSPPGSEFLSDLNNGIREARQLAGLPVAAVAASAPSGTTAAPVAAGGARITGSVRLAPALAAQVSPEDTVFVLARPADGSRMPLALARYQVKDLPVQFTLDDSMAMSPAAKLSSQARVVVVARISKSGQAVPAPGDISGQSAAVPNNTSALSIELSEVIKP